MSERLLKAFQVAKEVGGVQAQFRLAIRSGMSIVKAEKAPDNEANLVKMKHALTEIIGREVDI